MALQNSGKLSTLPGLAIVVIGVSGCGKTTIGSLLAEVLRCSFLDADNFHTQENIEKMRRGDPLTDADRFPWLEKLRHLLSTYITEGRAVVLACSALRSSYRDILRGAASENSRLIFIHLKASELLVKRLEARFRAGQHYMPPSLLKSQVALLELRSDEKDVITVETSSEPRAIVDCILTLVEASGKKSLSVQPCERS